MTPTFNGPTLERGGAPYVGAYILTHADTGKFYVGSTSNFKRRRLEHIKEFRYGQHHVPQLQELYDQSPNFTFEFIIAGRGDDPEIRQKAYGFEQDLLNKFWGNPLLLNSSMNARGSRLEGEREVQRLRGLEATRQDPKRLEPMRLAMSSPEYLQRNAEFLREMRNRPEQKAKAAEIARSQWADPEARAKKLAARQTPEFKAKRKDFVDSISKKVSIDGVVYDGIKPASIALGMGRNTIKRRLASDDFPNYVFVE